RETKTEAKHRWRAALRATTVQAVIFGWQLRGRPKIALTDRLMADWRTPIRTTFAALAGRRSDEIPLAEAALLIAAEEYPDLDVGVYLARIDALADEVREEVDNAEDARTAGTALTAFLYEREA